MEKIHVSLIIEILGRPAENVKEAIQTIVTRIGSEKGVKVINKQFHEPNLIEKSNDLFTTFVELELELDELSNYFGIIFAYMPSHIEIINPEKITLQNVDLNVIGNALVQRLHNYDAITKGVINERNIILEKLKEISPETFKKLTSKEDSSQQK